MCSIIGYCGRPLDRAAFDTAFSRTQSRGPDDTRVVEVGQGLLGFHRLSIMGLHPEGMQPFHLGKDACVCNGELYGFRPVKEKLAEILKELCTLGKTVVIATHDIDFAGEYGDYISFLSNGEIVTTKPRREFFSSLSFYTTCVSKITNGLADGYVGEIDLRDGGVL